LVGILRDGPGLSCRVLSQEGERSYMFPRSISHIRSTSSNSSRKMLVRGLRVIVTTAMMLAAVAGWNQPASAVETAALSTASATPADVQLFVALGTDATDSQTLKAQELLGRAGLPVSTDVLSTTVGSVTETDTESLETVSNFVEGEVAIGVRGLNLDELSGLSDVSLDDGLDQSSLEDAGFGAPTGIAIVVTASNMAESVAAIEGEFRQEALEAGATVEESEVEGARVLSVGVGAGIEGAGNVMAIVEDAIILSGAVEDVTPYILASNGSIPALANDPDFVTTMNSLPAEALVAGFAPAVSDADYEATEALLQEAGFALSLQLLFEQGGATGFAISAADEGFRVDTVQLQATGGQATPVAVPDEVDLTLAERVPEDSVVFMNGAGLGDSIAFRLIEQVLVAVLGVFSGSTEPAPVITQQYLDQQYDGLEMLFGFNVQTDFIRQLQGEYGFALTHIDVSDPSNIQAVLVSEVDDPLVVTDALRSLGGFVQAASEGQASISTVTVGDSTVNQITVQAEGSEIVVQYGVVNDELVLSIGNALVEYVLGTSPTLVDNPGYQEALGYLPAEHDSIYYVGIPALIELGSSMAEGVSADVDSGIVDSSDRCVEFVDQAAAQQAYDDDPVTNFDLDLDFDGVACDDFFEGSVSGEMDLQMAFEVNVGVLALVSYQQDGMSFTSGILVIPDES